MKCWKSCFALKSSHPRIRKEKESGCFNSDTNSHPETSSKHQCPRHEDEKWEPSDPNDHCSRSFSPLLFWWHCWWLLTKNWTVSAANMMINLRLWISPSCLVQVSTVDIWKASPQRKRHLCWLQRQLENSSASGNPWKGRHCTERNNYHSKNDWQIQSSVNTRVYKQRSSNLNLWKAGGAPLRPILNLATVLELWRGKHTLRSEHHYFCDSNPTLFSILLQLHSPGFWACVPRQGDANSYLGLEGGRKSWFLNTTANWSQIHVCEFLPTVIMAPPQPSRVFPCFS